jgi:hypothetical protein
LERLPDSEFSSFQLFYPRKIAPPSTVNDPFLS